MNLVIVGSIGIDDIETPVGKVEGALGGSGIYASLGASYFTKPGLVGIMGTDFPEHFYQTLSDIDLAGVEKKGKNFRWKGAYYHDMNEAKTLETQINSLAEFDPVLPDHYRAPGLLFLGNTDPDTQLKVIDQVDGKTFIMLDTMNFWIANKLNSLLKVIRKTDLLVVNDQEARQLTKLTNLIAAGKALLKLGPKYVIIKKGEHGALLFSGENIFCATGYPLENLCDPTGCGDTFAGTIAGYLSKTNEFTLDNIKKAVVYGSVVASFCAEGFSVSYKEKIALRDIEERYNEIKEFRRF